MVFSSLTDIILLQKHWKESCCFTQTNAPRFKGKKKKEGRCLCWEMTYLVNIVHGNCSYGITTETCFRYCNYCIFRVYEHCIFRLDDNLCNVSYEAPCGISNVILMVSWRKKNKEGITLKLDSRDKVSYWG